MKNYWSLFLNLPFFLKYCSAGILLGLGFALPFFWWLVFLGLALFIFLIEREESYKKIIFGGIVAFSTKTLFATSMILSVYPINVIEVNLGNWEFFVIFLFWFFVSVSIGLGGGLLAFILKVFLKFFPNWSLFFIFPFLVIACELFGSWLFSIFTLGEGGTINFVYSLGYVGYLLAEHTLFIQLSSFAGVYGLSFLVAFFSVVVWFLIKKSILKNYYLPLIIFFSLLIISDKISFAKPYVFNPEAKTVAIVDTNFSDEYFKNPDVNHKLKIIKEAVQKALELKTDYIILPEGSNYNIHNLTPESAYKIFRFENSNPKTILIDTSQAEWKRGTFAVRANIFDGINQKGFGIDKQYLTPQGEYLPYLAGSLVKLFGGEESYKKLKKELPFKPGPFSKQIGLPNEVPALLFCFESLDPYAVKRLLKERGAVPFVAHPISHSWFHESKVLKRSLDTMLKVQAVWSGVSIVSAGNVLEGALYTPDGQKIIPDNKENGDGWKVGVISL